MYAAAMSLTLALLDCAALPELSSAPPTAMLDDEAQLLAQCRAGDWSGYGRLVERYQRLVWAAVDSVALDSSEAADLQQEVFVRAFEKLHLYTGRASFSSWLYRLARNHALNHLRRRKRRPGLLPTDSVPQQTASRAHTDPARRYDSAARSLLLRRLLADLPQQQHEALARFTYLEQSYETIAREMRLPLNTLRTQLRRARLRLRDGARAAGWELELGDE